MSRLVLGCLRSYFDAAGSARACWPYSAHHTDGISREANPAHIFLVTGPDRQQNKQRENANVQESAAYPFAWPVAFIGEKLSPSVICDQVKQADGTACMVSNQNGTWPGIPGL
jgi:hypothetical protein